MVEAEEKEEEENLTIHLRIDFNAQVPIKRVGNAQNRTYFIKIKTKEKANKQIQWCGIEL